MIKQGNYSFPDKKAFQRYPEIFFKYCKTYDRIINKIIKPLTRLTKVMYICVCMLMYICICIYVYV